MLANRVHVVNRRAGRSLLSDLALRSYWLDKGVYKRVVAIHQYLMIGVLPKAKRLLFFHCRLARPEGLNHQLFRLVTGVQKDLSAIGYGLLKSYLRQTRQLVSVQRERKHYGLH